MTRKSLQLITLAGALWALVAAGNVPARAAELVMFQRAGCPWCAIWNREIAPIYPKTDLARRAPLRRVDLDRGGRSDVTLKSPILYTPTFVLVDGGREIGRIEGYPGEDFFWGLLEGLVLRLQSQPSDAPRG